MIWTVNFWQGAGERAIRTFAQAAAAMLSAGAVGVMDVDWMTVLSVALLAALMSLFTSIGNADFVAGPIPGDRFKDENGDNVPDVQGDMTA